MKLRHVLAVAAVSAVIAPAALLAAPAAFAEGPAASESSPAATASPSPSDSAPAPAESQSASPSATASTTPSADTTPAADATTPAAGDGTPAVAPPASASASASASSTPTAEPTDCPVDEDDVDLDSKLEMDVRGLPGKIVAGSGWHPFTLRATNTSDQDLGAVQWALFVDNDSMSDNENTWLSTFAKVQYWDEAAKTWTSMSAELGNGILFGETELASKQYVDLKLRVDIGAKAPKGDGYTVGFGGYIDAKDNCFHSAFSEWDFQVLAPGSDNENPGKAEPGKGDKDSDGGKKPQGGTTSEITATGSLAETGSSSMVPAIGITGGLAVALGAGALVVVRRRKAGSAV
jgi:LPXTG-motif cell wall-anchored protein